MFPAGRPGIALLLVRIAVGIMLVDGLSPRLSSLGVWLPVAPVILAIALAIGVLTPAVATLSIVLEIITRLATGGTFEAVHACAVFDAVAIALLGPGAYSVDARLFGPRQVVLPTPRDGDAD